ncbi:NAD(P)H-binding protein [Amycolatopsis sp. SID8362]|uniref:NAD(P)H-binding protein n=1 Tax=Amycolatopsis sp. SID8362 TaxID=2690346 RepID=UPI0013694135|nr:NAD(P)H-binding protein [Amycolatopsis sp. SID8362]NBH11603.1 NAD(P)H-binding protein [Amycolatopsis sp. SID8362]NED48295.1 NAD(P)H-binding protein [Amycolatopsis sp. SID8362]
MIVIVGATGNVGTPLVRMLAEAGEEVTAVSRRIAEAPPGVVVRQGDLASPSTLPVEGASAVFLMVPPDFRGSLAPVLARAGGARVVLLSSQGVGTGRHPAVFEEEVRASGLEWTVLRPGGFASNAFQWAESVRSAREVVAPFGDVALPVVDPEDIAAVAAAALVSPSHAGKTYVLTGPDPVTPREQAAAIGEAVGEPVRFVPWTREEALAAMVNFMPAEVAESTLDILGAPTPEEQRVSPDVARVLGRPPRSFAEWAVRFAGAFK